MNATGSYALGDVIVFALNFYSEVLVFGVPTITLNTGCKSALCVIPEKQSFFCAAEQGYFSIKLGDQYITNINVNTTSNQLRQRFLELDRIYDVGIKIEANPKDIRDRVCSKYGNTVVVEFTAADYHDSQGNIPEMELSELNAFPNPITGQPLGTQEFLQGLKDGYNPILSKQATEVVAGRNRTDSKAYYVEGNLTKSVLFRYQVDDGDLAQALDVVSIDFDAGYIASPFMTGKISHIKCNR